jgi:glucose-6-phosphate dehydrogenase assembly protein OpcA
MHRGWVIRHAEQIAAKHPARLIVLDATGMTDGSKASSSNGDQVKVPGDRVDLDVEDLDAVEIGQLAYQLCVDEVPTIVWWSAACASTHNTYATLAESANSIIVDSSGCVGDNTVIRDLATFKARKPRGVLHDLAFLRLAPWQEMVAQFFDDTAIRADLSTLRSLEIDSGSEGEALYFAGWIASVMGWNVLGPAAFQAADGATVSFKHTVKGARRRVLRVALRSESTQYVAAVCAEDPTCVELSSDGSNARPPRLGLLHRIDNASLIEHAILTTAHDPIFEMALTTVAELLA